MLNKITLPLVLAAAFLANAAFASKVCPSLLYAVPQCCSTDLLNVLNINCGSPTSANDISDFKTACQNSGSSNPYCCTIPAATLGVLCIPPVGFDVPVPSSGGGPPDAPAPQETAAPGGAPLVPTL